MIFLRVIDRNFYSENIHLFTNIPFELGEVSRWVVCYIGKKDQ